MASLKQKYGEVLDFYFIDFGDERANYIVEDFGVERHPEIIFLDADNNMISKAEGYSEGMEEDLRNYVEEMSK